jgi:hypothetical protein
VCLKRLFGRVGVAEVPDQHERVLVGGDSGDESGRNIGIPGYCADSLPPKVIQRKVLLLALDVPDSNKAATASCSQNVRHLLVPVQRRVFVRVRASFAEPE